MKKIFKTMILIALLLLPLAAFAQSERNSTEAPQVSQALVPEGDFAFKLVTALGLGTPSGEAQAEDMLTSVGIAPRNGWIADYPVTPDIVGELQDAVGTAADSKKLPMEKVEALKAFQDLTTEFGLAVVPGSSGQYAENQPQPDPTVINNYYYEEGPPVVTYYPPPWDYYYLYAWVPYPFWSGGFFFSGFFCLHDFHRVVFVGRHRFVVSNHVINPVSKTAVRVDPVGRRTGNGFRTANISHSRGFNTSDANKGAASIFNRGVERSRSSNMTTTLGRGSSNGNIGSLGSRRQSEGRVFTSSGNNAQSFTGRSSSRSESFGRSIGPSSRSFSAPSMGSSSSCANCHGSSGSFGRSGGGSSSGGFSSSHSSGGFSGGHSSGGFSGGGFSGGHGGGGGRGR
jgi:hypothetical protein